MTWRTISIPGAILLLAFILSIQGADADPPYVKEGAPTEVTFDEDETYTDLNLYDIFADDDPEDARLNLTYHQVEDMTISIAWVTGAVTILPNVNFYGQVNVVFIATDNNGSPVTHGLTVNILPVNDPPIIKQYIQKQTIREEESVTIDLEDYNGGPVFEDIEGKPLIYRCASDGDILVSITGSVVTFTGAPDFVGLVTDLVIWAEDDLGDRSENMALAFEVLNNGNPPPAVTRFEPNGTSITIEEGEATIFRILEVSEIEVDMWRYIWYIDGEVVGDGDSPSFSYPVFTTEDEAFNTSGIYKVKVDVMWFEGDAWILVRLVPKWTQTVLDVNRPPEVRVLTEDQKVISGNIFRLQVEGFDPDDENMSFRWYHSRDMVETSEVGIGERVSVNEDLSPGKHYYQCEVSDGKDTTTSEWVTFTVEQETHGPSGIMAAMALFAIAISLIAVLKRQLATFRGR